MGGSTETVFAHLDYRCIALQNKSCSVDFALGYGDLILSVFMLAVSVLTVGGNMVVIVAIGVFKQLHTPTNFIVLSLAVCDFLVGGLMIPLQSVILLDKCLHHGKSLCPAFIIISSVVGTASLMNIVLIAADRYFALCHPFCYVAKMNVKTMLTCIGFGWSFSLSYNLFLMSVGSSDPENGNPICIGACALPVNATWGIIDFIFAFIIPCALIITLYIRILMVAMRHATAISNTTRSTVPQTNRISELKATKTLGTVVLVYLVCWIPWYICLLNINSFPNLSVIISYMMSLFYSNSCINPIIYAISYPWFKKSFKFIILHLK